MRKVLLYFACKYKGNYKEIYNAIKEKESVSNEDLIDIESKINCKYVTLIDKEYPEIFKYMGTPPLVLFYHGDITLLDQYKYRQVAIIGKREASDYGKINAINIVKGLKDRDCVVVSGLAKGIDSIAHETALENNIKTIAVLGSGINNCYPKSSSSLYKSIKEKGLVISEYPFDEEPKPDNFLIRNRIIAAIATKIVVIEADYKSGTMNTVANGIDMGKDIYAIPYLANTGSGCNRLIKEGAVLVEQADDIFD